MNKAIRISVITFSAIMGMAGIEHGIGEILQGNVIPDGLMILSWPGVEEFQLMSGEPAMTIIPNLLISGIVAILFSLAFVLWSVLFVQRRNGGLVLSLLGLAMLLTGGGIFPPILGIILGLVGTRIHSPLIWWRLHLPARLRGLCRDVWTICLGISLISWLMLLPGIALLDHFFGISSMNLFLALLLSAGGSMVLSILMAFGADSQTLIAESPKAAWHAT